MSTNIEVLKVKVGGIEGDMKEIKDYPVMKERLNHHLKEGEKSAKKGYAIIVALSTLIAAGISALANLFG